MVQGGLRILDKIEALQFATWRLRPRLTLRDAPIAAVARVVDVSGLPDWSQAV